MFVLVTGGSGSGKSVYAESRVLQMGEDSSSPERIYIATMQCLDDESRSRAARHRKMRSGKGFCTIEQPLFLEEMTLPKRSGTDSVTCLLECMSNLAANEMFDPLGRGEEAAGVILDGIDRLLNSCDNLVVVTNEDFEDGLLYTPAVRRYQALLGKLNRRMADLADEVVEVVYGLPHVLKKRKQQEPERGKTA